MRVVRCICVGAPTENYEKRNAVHSGEAVKGRPCVRRNKAFICMYVCGCVSLAC